MCSPGVGCVEMERSLCAAGCKERGSDNVKGKRRQEMGERGILKKGGRWGRESRMRSKKIRGIRVKGRG